MSKVSVLGTGSRGKESLWNGFGMEEGIHLRWFFDPDLGFPQLGFRLFWRINRGIHQLDPDNISLNGQSIYQYPDNLSPSLIIRSIPNKLPLELDTSSAGERGFRVSSQQNNELELDFTPVSGYVVLKVYPEQGGKLTIHGSTAGNVLFEMEADKPQNIELNHSLDKILIKGDGLLIGIEYSYADINEEWKELTRIGLPVTHKGYRVPHSHNNGSIAGDIDEAISRIPKESKILDHYIGNGNADVFSNQLYPELAAAALHRTPPKWQGEEGGPDLEQTNESHLEMLLLSALDPYIARIMGLYYIDSRAGLEFVDYKLEGEWLKKESAVNTIPALNFKNLQKDNDSWDSGFHINSDCRPGIAVDSLDFFKLTPFTITIDCPNIDYGKVSISGTRKGRFTAFAILRNGRKEQLDLNTIIGSNILLSAAFKDIQSIVIMGNGQLSIHSIDYEADFKVECHSDIAYRLYKSKVEPLPEAPANLQVFDLKGWSKTSDRPDKLCSAGLYWDLNTCLLDGERLLQPKSILAMPEFYDFNLKPDQPKPQLNSAGQLRPVIEWNTVLINNETKDESYEDQIKRLTALEFLITGKLPQDPVNPAPCVDTLYYIHKEIKEGWYAYRVSSVDIFGRRSIPDNKLQDCRIVKLQKETIIPAPILLQTKYIQRGIPKLMYSGDELAYLNNNPDTNGLKVAWMWPKQNYELYPEVLKFDIIPPGAPKRTIGLSDPKNHLSGKLINVNKNIKGRILEVIHVSGNITGIEKIGNKVFCLETDYSLWDETKLDAFTGANFYQEPNAFSVIGNTVGQNIKLWIETDGAAEPGEYSFSLDQSFIRTDIRIHREGELLQGFVAETEGASGIIGSYLSDGSFLIRHNPSDVPNGRITLYSYITEDTSVSITKILEESNKRTYRVEARIIDKAGNLINLMTSHMLAGSRIEYNDTSFEIMNSTSGDSVGNTVLELACEEMQELYLNTIYNLKQTAYYTVEADTCLDDLSRQPGKVKGVLEQSSNKQIEFPVIGYFNVSSALNQSAAATCFIVSADADMTPAADCFIYYPTYETIIDMPQNNLEINISSVTELSVKIERIISQDNMLILTTDRKLTTVQNLYLNGSFRYQNSRHEIINIISAAPFTFVIKRDNTTENLRAGSNGTIHSKEAAESIIIPDKSADVAKWYTGGILKQNAQFEVLGFTEKNELIVRNSATNSRPAAGKAGYHPVSNEQPKIDGYVTMKALGVNNESAESTALSFTVVYYRSPEDIPQAGIASDIPVTLDNPPCLLADAADWYGISDYKLHWDKVEGISYNLYRAMDLAVYDADIKCSLPRSWKAAGGTIRMSDLPARIVQGMPADPVMKQAILNVITEDFNVLDAVLLSWRNAASEQKPGLQKKLYETYKNLRNDTQEVLANMTHISEAFSLLNNDPIKPESSSAEYTDNLPGNSTNRFFYRITGIDNAGNIGLPGPVSTPVRCPDLNAPLTPIVKKVLGGERCIILRWSDAGSIPVSQYRIYRSDNENDAEDIRLMTGVASIGSVERIKVKAGTIYVRNLDGIQSITGVYLRSEVSTSNSQPASVQNHLPQDAAAWIVYDKDRLGATVYGLGSIPDETEIAVVLIDKIGKQIFADRMPNEFIDCNLQVNKDYFYRITAERTVKFKDRDIVLSSQPSRFLRARAVNKISLWT